MSNIITIDGPTSSGKTSVGLLFSQKIGYQFIDTGAIYRAGSLYVLRHGIPIENEERVTEVFNDLDISFKIENGSQRIFIDGEDVTDSLHSPQVTSVVPVVAAHRSTREAAKHIQRKIGTLQDTVMTGRDIGSEIFPNAPLKFFLTASPEVRAKRRYDQIKKTDSLVTFDSVLANMLKRDEMDSTREASPFRKPPDAIVVDTTNMSTDESVDMMCQYYGQIFGDKTPRL